MGIYIFNTNVLKKYLLIDNNNEYSSNDFGKDVIPLMLRDGCKMFAYPFLGYWRDVGTTESLMKANLDLLSDSILTRNPDWKVYSNSPELPPTVIKNTSCVKNSLIAEGCHIKGEVVNSVIFGNVIVSENAFIKDSVIFSGSKILNGARILNCILDEGSKVGKNCTIGDENYLTVVKRNSDIHTNITECQKSVVS